ncbi:MAG: hypothetical protein R3211_10615, partial [Balneolaceae bacterium]|nr:hypothetical protein [Balneolaceae bacterium]
MNSKTTAFVTGFIILIVSLAAGCADPLLDNQPSSDNTGMFETVWTDMDRNYSFFELKDVDWNALYDRYRPQVTVGGNDDQLFDALSAMLGELRDGHITLYT